MKDSHSPVPNERDEVAERHREAMRGVSQHGHGNSSPPEGPAEPSIPDQRRFRPIVRTKPGGQMNEHSFRASRATRFNGMEHRSWELARRQVVDHRPNTLRLAADGSRLGDIDSSTANLWTTSVSAVR